MIRPSWKYLVVALVIVGAILASGSQAQACWWRHCGNWGWGYGSGWYGCGSGWYGCGYGGYGCGYGYGYTTYYSGLYGSYGSLWGCGLYGHCAYYSPCWGCYDVCGCTPVDYSTGVGVPGPVIDGGAAPTPAPPQAPADTEPELPVPTMPAPPAPAPGAPPAPGTGTSTDFFPTRSTSGLLTVWAPADAKVTINGMETKSTGSKREYVSYGLVPGLSYKYVVRAEIIRDGAPVHETKEMTLTAGAQEGLAFDFNEGPTEQLARSF